MQLQGTEYSVYLDVLRLFAHGTWSDYKSKHRVLCSFSTDLCLIAASSYLAKCLMVHCYLFACNELL